MIELLYYVDPSGRSPFALWFGELDPVAFAKVTIAVTKLKEGKTGNVKAAGSGVHECRIDFGPGYRVYFGMDGNTLIILLGGGTKKRQQRDIADAKARWQDYKRRKGGREG